MTEQRQTSKKIRRRVVRTAVTLVVLAVVAALGYPVYVNPTVDSPAPADAIVVLGGSADNRDELGLQLAEDGYAPTLVYSDPYGSASRLTDICRDGHEGITVECFVPDPGTTRGEAHEIRERARAEGWTSVIVVTSTPHLSRARYIIDKCWDGEVTYVASTTDRNPVEWAWEYIYQTMGYGRALFEDC